MTGEPVVPQVLQGTIRELQHRMLKGDTMAALKYKRIRDGIIAGTIA